MAEILPLNEETMDIEIELCLRLHPSGFVHDEEYFRRGREMKRNFLKRVLRRVNPAGFVAVRGSKPAGLLELMPREYARLNGYITGTKGDDGLTLTIACLEVAVGEDRSSVM
ncbi:MAG: hypothetical protein JSV18_05425 [Candidatus Bathyarchaeota archaeon]|nr:MAG: hypothetical protein JSV18_05425 [Candidatus Bathyarchaeota archaeon]